jgi:hypothetical protein
MAVWVQWPLTASAQSSPAPLRHPGTPGLAIGPPGFDRLPDGDFVHQAIPGGVLWKIVDKTAGFLCDVG